MANEIIFENWLFRDYLLPFLLVFVLVFAVLEKTKLLGDGKQQLDAILSFVIGLIVVGFLFPKEVMSNLIMFLSISLVVVFVFLLLYGFVSGNKDGFELDGNLKKVLGAIVFIAVVIAVIYATGFNSSLPDFFQNVIDFLFRSSWSGTFWINAVFIGIFVFVVAWVLKSAGTGGS